MVPLIVPDGRGKGHKITADMVRQIVEVAKELKSKGRRIRLKSFTRQLTTEEDIALSSKKVGEILIANSLYKPEIRRRRPGFYQALRQGIPNGLVSDALYLISSASLTIFKMTSILPNTRIIAEGVITIRGCLIENAKNKKRTRKQLR